jgi:signal peptidase II
MSLYLKLKKIFLIIYKSSQLIIKLVAIDQLTKIWLVSYLKHRPYQELEVTSFFDIVYMWNYGISFGIFKNYHQLSNSILLIVNSTIVAYLYYILLRCRSVLSFVGYSALIGGAVGNLIDRIFKGAVFDFIHFHYKILEFPVFNLADSFISIGVVFLLYDNYKTKKVIEEKNNNNYDEVDLEAEKIRKLDDNNINFTER